MTFIACTKAIFADCSSMNIRIALPYPLDGGTKLRRSIALGWACETRQLLLSLFPHPGGWVDRQPEPASGRGHRGHRRLSAHGNAAPCRCRRGRDAGQRSREGVDGVVAGRRRQRRHWPPHLRGRQRSGPCRGNRDAVVWRGLPDAESAAVANYAMAHFGGKQGQVTAKDVADARPEEVSDVETQGSLTVSAKRSAHG